MVKICGECRARNNDEATICTNCGAHFLSDLVLTKDTFIKAYEDMEKSVSLVNTALKDCYSKIQLALDNPGIDHSVMLSGQFTLFYRVIHNNLDFIIDYRHKLLDYISENIEDTDLKELILLKFKKLKNTLLKNSNKIFEMFINIEDLIVNIGKKNLEMFEESKETLLEELKLYYTGEMNFVDKLTKFLDNA